ncbi:MAG: hypothetical protein RL525_368 [Bacteroidota bacterium]|jgi:hypothetical protein
MLNVGPKSTTLAGGKSAEALSFTLPKDIAKIMIIMAQKRFIATKLKKKAFVSKRLLNFLVKKLISEQQELQQQEQQQLNQLQLNQQQLNQLQKNLPM